MIFLLGLVALFSQPANAQYPAHAGGVTSASHNHPLQGTPSATATSAVTATATSVVTATSTSVVTATATSVVTSTATVGATNTPAPTNTPSCGAFNEHYFTATLSGANEVPPNTSPATGTGTFFLDAGGTLHYNITFQGLVAPETAAHFHVGLPGVAGPVIIPLPLGNPKVGSAPFPPTYTTALLAGNVYVNIHSQTFPGGEIRDQLHEQCGTPTPGATGTAGATGTVVATSTATRTATPAVTCQPPTRIPTPAFTPAPGCQSQPASGDLEGDITVMGATSQAVYQNHSATCSYPIGLAVYRRFDNRIDNQELYDYRLDVIAPNSVLTLTVNNPPCSFQVDAFWGEILYSLNGFRYGQRLLQDEIRFNGGFCTGGCNPTPGPTGTPGTPGPTATALANCPTFSDVDPGNPFYNYIRCLVCRGVLSGYADGTYRWGNEVTRGQVAKIIVNAAGYVDDIPANKQSFLDVPHSNPFWLFVERALHNNVISGYSDGTFRPNASMTRGQIAKVTSLAAGHTEQVTSQTFTDVPASHPFYVYIERMARRGILSGYADGTFRPGASVTRGQTAKVVGNAFFPGCR